MSKKKIRNLLVLSCAFMLLIGTAYADPFISYPGTRARGMGGAFTAVADDASAVWYNPAGLVGGDEKEFIAEWSQALARKKVTDPGNSFTAALNNTSQGELDNDANKFFLGFKTSNKKIGWGIFYLSPYSIDWYFPPQPKVNKAFGQLKEEMHIFGISGAISTLNDRLNFGISGEYVYTDYNDANVWYVRSKTGNTYNVSRVDSIDDSVDGFSGSLGVLGVPLDNKPLALKIKVGGVYRFESSKNADTGSTTGTKLVTDQLLFAKPASWDAGIAVTKAFTKIKSAFTLSAQYGVTDWSTANDGIENEYEKISLGAEWQIAKKLAFLERLSLRGGYYDSQASRSEDGWPDVDAITWGVGARLGKKVGVEFAYEYRAIDYAQAEESDQEFSLFSLSLSYIF